MCILSVGARDWMESKWRCYFSDQYIAVELKSLEYQLLVWLCEQLQAAHLSGTKCIFSSAPDYFQPLHMFKHLLCMFCICMYLHL
jgi:hypothetical protein